MLDKTNQIVITLDEYRELDALDIMGFQETQEIKLKSRYGCDVNISNLKVDLDPQRGTYTIRILNFQYMRNLIKLQELRRRATM